MRDLYSVLIVVVATAVTGGTLFAFWVANKKRIAAETVGRAEEQALRILQDAEREADAKKKEAILDAKEKAHDIQLEAERVYRDRRQEISILEQSLGDKTRSLAERLTATDRLEKDLRGR